MQRYMHVLANQIGTLLKGIQPYHHVSDTQPVHLSPHLTQIEAISDGSIELDRTQWTVLRDHTNRVLYFRSPANPQYQVKLLTHK